MKQKIALAVIIALVGIFVLSYKAFDSTDKKQTINPKDIPQQISIQGEFRCIPFKDEKNANPLDCTLGVRTDNNIYYAIDAQGEAAKQVLFSLETGAKIQIDGTLVPIEQISSDVWQKYDVSGIVITNNIKRIY